MKTEFASPELATQQELESDISSARNLPLVQELVQLIPVSFAILNPHRQIVHCNSELVRLVNAKKAEHILGMRLGEALQCRHAFTREGGCGTTNHCRYCGAVNAILDSKNTQNVLKESECQIASLMENQSFEFKIKAKTWASPNKEYTMVIMDDISDSKRRDALERIFFHDIMNTAGGIQGLISLMNEASGDELDEYIDLASASSEVLLDELNAQKDLLAAERGTLEVEFCPVNSLAILNSVKGIYQNHGVAKGKKIDIAKECADLDFFSDQRLLVRVIGNMVKNGLEAEGAGKTVFMGAALENEHIRFWVRNASVLPPKIKLQMFKRSFSTKGRGRGLGTYSIQLLGEHYLKGKVGVSSEDGHGTTFFIHLPLK